MRRRLVLVAALATVVLVAVVALTRGPHTQVVGHGATSATIITPPSPHGATVLFLHGWGGMSTKDYGAWIDHLVDEGHTVVFPKYQDSETMPGSQALPNALAGIRAAFAKLHIDRLVAVGHSAGGALTADYAAIAPSQGLPEPAAIMLCYPGRVASTIPGSIPEVGDQMIPPATQILAFASNGDTVVGTATDREVVQQAGHGQLVMVTTPGATDHVAPGRATKVVRQVFWAPLDQILQQVG